MPNPNNDADDESDEEPDFNDDYLDQDFENTRTEEERQEYRVVRMLELLQKEKERIVNDALQAFWDRQAADHSKVKARGRPKKPAISPEMIEEIRSSPMFKEIESLESDVKEGKTTDLKEHLGVVVENEVQSEPKVNIAARMFTDMVKSNRLMRRTAHRFMCVCTSCRPSLKAC